MSHFSTLSTFIRNVLVILSYALLCFCNYFLDLSITTKNVVVRKTFAFHSFISSLFTIIYFCSQPWQKQL